MKNNDFIKTNNDLRQKLNKENKKHYEDLLIQVRLRGMFVDEKNLEITLLEILHDLIQAQENNKTFEEILGKDKKKLAKEIVANSKKSSKKIIVRDILSWILTFSSVFFFTYTAGENVEILGYDFNNVTNSLVALVIFGIILLTIGLYYKNSTLFLPFILPAATLTIFKIVIITNNIILSDNERTFWIIGLIFITFILIPIISTKISSNNK